MERICEINKTVAREVREGISVDQVKARVVLSPLRLTLG